MVTRLEKLGVKSHKYRANKVTYLELDNQLLCPLCRKHKENWHVNHFVLAMDGGKNTKYNLTVLCAMCHRMLHDGEEEERLAMWSRLNLFMLSRYGIVGKKDLLKRALDEIFMDFCLNDIREIHKVLKKECEMAYYKSFQPNINQEPTPTELHRQPDGEWEVSDAE